MDKKQIARIFTIAKTHFRNPVSGHSEFDDISEISFAKTLETARPLIRNAARGVIKNHKGDILFVKEGQSKEWSLPAVSELVPIRA